MRPGRLRPGKSLVNNLMRLSPPMVCFKEQTDISVSVEDRTESAEKDDDLLCRQCRQIIARVADMISVNGTHRHVFANPHGIVYEIGCFCAATGCGYASPASTEFTWFPGYVWRILACTGCLSHLGWAFTGKAGDQFYGLILDRLVRV